jgi:hypothetical protein
VNPAAFPGSARRPGIYCPSARTAGEWHEAVLVKRLRHSMVVWLSMSTLFTVTDAAKAGPFQDFFKTLRGAIAHLKETPRPHRSAHKRKKTPPSDAPNSQTSDKSALPGQPDVPSPRLSAGNLGRRPLHRQNFPYAIRSAHIMFASHDASAQKTSRWR